MTKNAPPSPDYVAQMQQQALLFVKYQEQLDAAAVARLFEPKKGFICIPAGNTPVVGRENIQQNFQSFYDGVASLREQIVGPILQANTFIGFAKSIQTTSKAGVLQYRQVINWFKFTSPGGRNPMPRIAEFWEIG